MKILVIPVGGTITTATTKEGTLDVSESATSCIFEKYSSLSERQVEFTLTENLFILSENMTVEDYGRILSLYKKNIGRDAFDGVIILHGTDTLAFTASLFSFLIGFDIPVFFVSANAPLHSPRSNGTDNLFYAVECIARGITAGVFAVYKNISDGRVYLHLASRLEQCRSYSEDFTSVGMTDITELSDETFKKINSLYPREKRNSFFEGEVRLTASVLLITPFVGMNYDIDVSGYSAILHSTYHSGTANAEGVLSLSKKGVDLYLSPAKSEGEVYDSVRRLSSGKVNFLYGTTLETAWAKLLLAYSNLSDKEEIKSFLSTECNFERIKND